MGIVHIFVADIHLRPDSKDQDDRFISWLHGPAADADGIYILGDLFDYWYTGIEARFKDILEALQSPRICLLPGNRDFLLSDTPLEGINIIRSEEIVITIGPTKVLIAHGHTLTHGDPGFNLMHRYGWPILRNLDRWLPLPLKDLIAQRLIRSSRVVRHLTAGIREGIAIERGVDMVICGHLHRSITRPGLIVLPAFHDTGAWLAWDNAGPRLCTK
ncbi:MAG TPA: UDP-2,3-diacylglucosamine diphosphatase [Desulfomonilia bacterium]|nr:UDP-2,3-diacylglucosamine diphosphatase [Desulfomonilia bacterium]